MRNNLQEIAVIFFFEKIFLYKTLFIVTIVGNTCKFYNFVGNNNPRWNYLLIKILRKNGKNKPFLANFLNKFARKISCNMKFSSSATDSPRVLSG